MIERISEIIFWSFLGLTGFVYFGYPLVMALIPKPRKKEEPVYETLPFISLIIPAHNEEAVIQEKVENILALDYPARKFEAIFALDGCTDRTKDILLKYQNGRVKVLEEADREGKVVTLNRTVPRAKGEIVVFTDANSIIKKDALYNLVKNFTDQRVGCVCGRLKYLDSDLTSLSKGESLYWKYEYFLKRQESGLGRLLVTNGSIQAVRKDLYPYPDPHIADDFSIPLSIQAKGYKVLYEPSAVVYEVATQSLREEFNQKIRIISQGLKGIISLRNKLLGLGPIGLFELLFHKILRWFVPVFMGAIFVSNAALALKPFYSYVFAGQLVFYAFACIGFLLRHKAKIRIFYIPFYFCLINLTSFIAILRTLGRNHTQTWDKARTTRVRAKRAPEPVGV